MSVISGIHCEFINSAEDLRHAIALLLDDQLYPYGGGCVDHACESATQIRVVINRACEAGDLALLVTVAEEPPPGRKAEAEEDAD
jgi:hypothetical protein